MTHFETIGRAPEAPTVPTTGDTEIDNMLHALHTAGEGLQSDDFAIGSRAEVGESVQAYVNDIAKLLSERARHLIQLGEQAA